MGVILNTAYLLMLEGIRKPFEGKVLQLGKQDVYLKWDDLKALAKHLNFPLKPISSEEIQLNKKNWCAPCEFITDVTFFSALGFSEVVSMDYSEYEGANYIWDANNIVPVEYHGKFDVIYDGGTGEHVFSVPNFFANICLMLNKNGRIIHDSPTAGLIDHGFYNIQPTLLYDFYKTNEFEINKACISKQASELMVTNLWQQIDYIPGMYDLHKAMLEDNNLYNTFFIATKCNEFKEIKIPQQSLWSRI